ncbi:hypothetical protein DC3_39870 [Deinococcus cellulosilyticus NBRC 106333 = KACC 11606]|uniref:Uncharacterized protein n=1 Tax=Deinococcus cellulosilyticus (strain DSM 18568 / NBRC 106333 / KACC 11606 / 5516J-15) TaxID=1223518 RepID=A0A511N657_DEIC1|nr:hypothetical protein DC3_39870 [Deinococcus cellulosilyticus NBRC 106333 = KACC 11606]
MNPPGVARAPQVKQVIHPEDASGILFSSGVQIQGDRYAYGKTHQPYRITRKEMQHAFSDEAAATAGNPEFD